MIDILDGCILQCLFLIGLYLLILFPIGKFLIDLCRFTFAFCMKKWLVAFFRFSYVLYLYDIRKYYYTLLIVNIKYFI